MESLLAHLVFWVPFEGLCPIRFVLNPHNPTGVSKEGEPRSYSQSKIFQNPTFFFIKEYKNIFGLQSLFSFLDLCDFIGSYSKLLKHQEILT